MDGGHVTQADRRYLAQLRRETIAAIAAEGKDPRDAPVYVGVRLFRALEQQVAAGESWARRISSAWPLGVPAGWETGQRRCGFAATNRTRPHGRR